MRKVAGAIPGQELYAISAASDQSLPPLPQFAVLGPAVDVAPADTRRWRLEGARARRAKVAAGRQRAELRQMAEACQTAESWRLAAEAVARSPNAARSAPQAARCDAEAACDRVLAEVARPRSLLRRTFRLRLRRLRRR
jgi:hypothetical protein